MNTPPDYVPQNGGDKSHRLISIHTLISAFCTSSERFPVTLAYLLAFAVWGVIDCWISDYVSFFVNNLRPAMWFLTTTGMLLSLAVSLWCEHYRKRHYYKVVQWIANILLWIDFVYIIWRINSFTNSEYIAHLALITSLIVANIFLPAIKHAPRRHNLMFSFAQFSNVTVSGGIAIILALAIAIICVTLEALFHIWSFRLFTSLEILFSASLSILIFISRIPTFSETVELVKNYEAEKFVVGVVKYLLLPLTAIYTIILYAYGFKIIIVGEFPNGVICMMVTALTAAVYMLLFMLKVLGSTQDGEDNLTKVSLRVFPIALIPLLVMMSFAIGERVGQYGITVDRLYVITFNIWAYATAIYLFISHSRNINSVAISFAVVFLLTSIIPGLNYTSMVYDYMQNSVISTLEKVGFDKSQFPLTHKQFEIAKEKMDDSSWADVRSKLLYIDRHDDHSLTEDIVGFDITTGYYSYDPLFENDKDIVEATVNAIELKFCANPDAVVIPEGYTNVEYISGYRYNQTVDSERLLDYQLSDVLKITLNMDSIQVLNPDSINDPLSFVIDRKSDSLYVVSSIRYLIYDDEFNENGKIRNMAVRGYLFTR